MHGEREGLKPNIKYAIKSGIRNPFKFCRYLCSLVVRLSSLFPLQEKYLFWLLHQHHMTFKESLTVFQLIVMIGW